MKHLVTIITLFITYIEANSFTTLPTERHLAEELLVEKIKQSTHISVYTSKLDYYSLRKNFQLHVKKSKPITLITQVPTADTMLLVKYAAMKYKLLKKISASSHTIMLFDNTEVCILNAPLTLDAFEKKISSLTCKRDAHDIKEAKILFDAYLQHSKKYLQ